MADLNLFPSEPNPCDIILRVPGAAGPQTVDVDGSVTPTGTVVFTITHNGAATVTATATVTRAVTHLAVGSVTPTGILGRAAAHTAAGTVGLSGDVTTTVGHIEHVAIDGAVTPTGTVDITVTEGPPDSEIPPTWGGVPEHRQTFPTTHVRERPRPPVVVTIQLDGHVLSTGAAIAFAQPDSRRRREAELLLVL